MSTNIDDDENYPLADDFEIDFDLPSFEEIWKSSLQFHPFIPHDWIQAEPLKKFSEELYNELIYGSNNTRILNLVQSAVNEAYADGKEDGYSAGKEEGLNEGYRNGICECVETLKELNTKIT